MSLHVLANHMASKGRGEDSMLVHMTPREVAGLQALALKHGGSLTINPDTGLVEAGWLSKLLPMIAGFALGPAGFGLMSAAGAGLTVGAVTGLATGSLSKGLMAGLGAYGGAGLGEAFAGAGTGAISSEVGKNAIANAGLTGEAALGTEADQIAANAIKDKLAGTSLTDKLGAGFNAVTKDASTLGNFAKDNWKLGLAAASPMIADAMVPTATKMPSANQVPGYIRPYQYDANTRTVTAQDPVLASEWGARQFPSFIPKKFDTGGIVALAEGGEPSADPFSRYNNLTGQSKAAYDYLMGNSAVSNTAPPIAIQNRPVVSNTNAPVTTPASGLPSGGVQDSPTTIVEPSAGIPTLIQPPEITPVETYDQDNQAAVNKVEEEVANEQYDQDNQAAIDQYENNLFDEANQEAVNRVEEGVQDDNFAESARASDIDDATISTDPVYPVDNTTADFWEPNPVAAPTPEELVNRDEWGNLQGAIEANMNPVQDDGTTDPIQNQILAQENPWGTLDDFIAAQTEAQKPQPDYVERGYENPAYVPDTYSGFTPEPANPNVPVEDRIPVSVSDDMRSALAAGVDPITGVAKDNGAIEAAIREQEAAEREEAQRMHEAMNWNSNAQPPVESPIDFWQPNPFDEPAPAPAPYVPEPVRDNAPDIQPYVQEPAPYVPAEEPRAPTYQDIYRPEEPVTPAEERQAAIDEYLYGGSGGGGGGGGRTDNMLAEYGGGDFGGDFGGYGNYGENMFAANGGLMGYARGGSARPFFSKETGKFSYKPPQVYANGGYALGGLGSLGGYSDGGRLLKGPGDGVSDSIPATIGAKGQPARLADGEFVVPARIVSELGNGSTEAGARKLYAMMDRIQKARGKTVGKGKVAANSRAEQHLPA